MMDVWQVEVCSASNILIDLNSSGEYLERSMASVLLLCYSSLYCVLNPVRHATRTTRPKSCAEETPLCFRAHASRFTLINLSLDERSNMIRRGRNRPLAALSSNTASSKFKVPVRGLAAFDPGRSRDSSRSSNQRRVNRLRATRISVFWKD